MNIDEIDPEIIAQREAEFDAICAKQEDEEKLKDILPLKLQIEQVEAELRQHKTKWIKLDKVLENILYEITFSFILEQSW